LEGIQAVDQVDLAAVDVAVRPDARVATHPEQEATPVPSGGATEDSGGTGGSGGPGRTIWPALRGRLQFWRSPEGQPAWARPALLAVAALAGVAYGWRMNAAYLEPFYGGAARSMASSWHNFFFGAADPWGTVSVDKLPGALWFQALSLRVFGFHIWAIVLPQVVEGILAVLVVYRATRRVAGAGAGIVAAVVMAGSPIVILLNRGNISDSLLILLLVLAADATIRAYRSGRLRSLVWAGVLVGFAFQAKMLEAWLVLPAFYAAYLVAAPARAFLRRLWHVAASALAVLVVSLSWMTAVTLVPQTSRPYVDGSCNDSLFAQVFSYNGFSRIGSSLFGAHGCSHRSQYLLTSAIKSERLGYGTYGISASWSRLLTGPLGRDIAWLLLPAVVAAIGLFVLRRRTARTDLLRGATILWTGWLVSAFAFFSASQFVNSYYLAALVPAVAALCGMGASAAWQRRRSRAVRWILAGLVVATVVITIALLPSGAGIRDWIIGSLVVAGLLATGVLVASLRRGHDSVWSLSVGPALAAVALLLGSFWASGVVVAASLSPFNTPYAPQFLNDYTTEAAAGYPVGEQALAPFVRGARPGAAVDVFETSAATGLYTLLTGAEFLPVGGFSGQVPAPSLTEFEQLVAEGKVRRVTLVTQPLTRAQDLRWVAAHCERTNLHRYSAFAAATETVFFCAPKDA
jgi:4-amino-4-deoxy-L-arabinose transferase-like glycosyltransferase